MRKNFKVPMLPYLKKYVERQIFQGMKAPYKIEEDSLIGKMIMCLIIDARQKDLRGDKRIEMSASIEFQLSEVMAERSPSLQKLVPINYFLDKLFKNELITWIKSAEIVGMRPFPASKAFLEFYRIDESEYSHDAAYRHWLRDRRKGMTRKITVPTVQNNRSRVQIN
jgi:hypothetical protein